MIIDAALATGLVSPADLTAALQRSARWPGNPAARRAIAFADGRSQSVGESRSRVAIHSAGLPKPALQYAVPLCAGGTAYADFAWPVLRTVGEFDGQIKYGRLLRPGQSAGDAVFAEKRREDAVRAEDLGVVRWTWVDLDHFAPTAARLHRTFRPT